MRLSGWRVPVDWLSASSLAMFIACPEQYRLRKIKRIPESMGLNRFIGIVDHNATATNLTQKISSKKDLPVEEVAGVYNTEWDQTIADEGTPDWGTSEEDAVKDQGLGMVCLYHTIISPSIQPIRVEARFEEKLPGVPVPLVGYPDVEEDALIIERKTSSKKMNKPKPGWVFQGNIYSMILSKPVAWHCVTKQVMPQITTPDTSPDLLLDGANHDATLRTLQQAAYLLNDTYIRYGENSVWPTLGTFHDWLCSYCSFGPRYGNSCAAWNPQSPYLNGDQ